MVFIPSVDNGVDDGFFDLVDSLLDDIYRQACLIPRLAAHIGQDGFL
jgi:dynein heavy chain